MSVCRHKDRESLFFSIVKRTMLAIKISFLDDVCEEGFGFLGVGLGLDWDWDGGGTSSGTTPKTGSVTAILQIFAIF